MRFGVLVLVASLAAPAAAQVAGPGVASAKPVAAPGPISKAAPINGILTLYGNERCPTDADGNEVVVCQRRSAAEQFRVPKELREFTITRENQAWAARAGDTTGAGTGVNAVGSCSVAAGGQTGCFQQAARADLAERRARKAAEDAGK